MVWLLSRVGAIGQEADAAPPSCCCPEQDVEVTVPWLCSTTSLLHLLDCHSWFSSSAVNPGTDRELGSSSTARAHCLLWFQVFGAALLDSLDE